MAAIARARMQAQPSQPGQGTQGGAMQQISMAIHLLQQAQAGLPPGSEPHTAVAKAVLQLSKHVAHGAPVAGAQQTAIQDMLRNTQRNAMLQRILAARQQGGGGAPPPGAQPSTPMPGA